MKTSLLKDFNRVSKANRCPICDHPDWCMVSKDNGSRILCHRVPSPIRWGAAGYLHRRGVGFREVGAPRRIPTAQAGAIVDPRFEQIAAMATRCRHLAPPGFARALGLSCANLERLGIGWMDEFALADVDMQRRGGVWSFPMRNQFGSVCGIRLRAEDGFKFAVTGSTNGLFIPRDLAGPVDRLVFGEGESDTAALLDLGFTAVGKPGAGNADAMAIALVTNLRPRSVVIVGDNDETGRTKAWSLGTRLASRQPDVRVIFPPAGVKDAREWKKRGADGAAVEAVIAATSPITFSVTSTRKGA